MSFDVSELDRRLANLIRIGLVAEVDLTSAPPAVKVDLGEQITDWLPWAASRAGKTRVWSAPDVGEQVVLLAPSGEMSSAIALPGIFYDTFGANGDEEGVWRVTFPDGSIIVYDPRSTTLDINVGSGTVNIHAPAVNVISGTVTVSGGDVIADGISLKNHTHGGVDTGGGNTAKPN